jgi:hypothetical protein
MRQEYSGKPNARGQRKIESNISRISQAFMSFVSVMIFIEDRETQSNLTRARAAILDYLPADQILKCYQNAGGSEIASGKFANLESSAALAANVFGLFLNRPELFSLPRPRVDFGIAQKVDLENQLQFPWPGGYHPWLDVVVTTERALIAIESKRYEPFRDKKTIVFSKSYLRPVWGTAMAAYEKMRDDLMSDKRHFNYLDAAQLVKHAFGLRTQANKVGKAAKLLYLYAEPKAYPDGRPIIETNIGAHRSEVQTFASDITANHSDVEFFSLTYADLLRDWAASANEELRMHASAISKRFDI